MTLPAPATPSIVISLDFELRWGVLDHVRDDFSAYRANLEGVPEAVAGMLDLFDERNVRATWAIVGGLACSGWDEWEARRPTWPAYERTSLRWRDAFRGQRADERLYFAPDLVDEVRRRGHELGSHTFTHLYMNEPGVTADDVQRDCDAMNTLFADRWSSAPVSLVFPRNQENHVDVLRSRGIRQWRSNPNSWYWDTTRPTTKVTRALRIADAFLPWPDRGGSVVDAGQRASHFVRVGLPNRAWSLHVRRIGRDASRLGPGETLHLWWHPHNLGAAPTRSVARLGELLDRIASLPNQPSFVPMGAVAVSGSGA